MEIGKRLAPACLAVLLLASGCGGSQSESHAEMGHDDGAADGFGSPADAAQADRTIAITAADPYEFDPEEISVDAGETVTFVVTNKGDQDHELVLGDRSYQESHEADMAAGDMEHDEGNAVDVPAGETAELTWTFSGDGEVLYACHEPGHYDGGMIGTIDVSSG